MVGMVPIDLPLRNYFWIDEISLVYSNTQYHAGNGDNSHFPYRTKYLQFLTPNRAIQSVCTYF